jgi:hypothetical protein
MKHSNEWAFRKPKDVSYGIGGVQWDNSSTDL